MSFYAMVAWFSVNDTDIAYSSKFHGIVNSGADVYGGEINGFYTTTQVLQLKAGDIVNIECTSDTQTVYLLPFTEQKNGLIIKYPSGFSTQLVVEKMDYYTEESCCDCSFETTKDVYPNISTDQSSDTNFVLSTKSDINSVVVINDNPYLLQHNHQYLNVVYIPNYDYDPFPIGSHVTLVNNDVTNNQFTTLIRGLTDDVTFISNDYHENGYIVLGDYGKTIKLTHVKQDVWLVEKIGNVYADYLTPGVIPMSQSSNQSLPDGLFLADSTISVSNNVTEIHSGSGTPLVRVVQSQGGLAQITLGDIPYAGSGNGTYLMIDDDNESITLSGNVATKPTLIPVADIDTNQQAGFACSVGNAGAGYQSIMYQGFTHLSPSATYVIDCGGYTGDTNNLIITVHDSNFQPGTVLTFMVVNPIPTAYLTVSIKSHAYNFTIAVLSGHHAPVVSAEGGLFTTSPYLNSVTMMYNQSVNGYSIIGYAQAGIDLMQV
jgi:hypothetical protein